MDIPILIGVHGVKQSGKGTLFQFVADWGRVRGLSAFERGFADEVKLAVARIFYPRITLEEAVKWADAHKEDADYGGVILGNDQPDMFVSLRHMLQHMGSEVGRDMWGEDFWVDRLLPFSMVTNLIAVSMFRFNDANLCGVTDVRFVNEVDRLNSFGALTIKLRNEKAEQRVVDEAHAQGRDIHRSELLVDDDHFVVTVENNSTLDDFKGDVFDIMDWYSGQV